MQDTQPPTAQAADRPQYSLQSRFGPKNRDGRGISPAITSEYLRNSAGALFPFDLHHSIGLGAARRHHFDLGAFLFSDQGARERGGDGNLAFLGVRLWLANDLP